MVMVSGWTLTVKLTEALEERSPLLTVSRKVTVVMPTGGAVKVVLALVGLAIVTAGPAVCFQEKVSGRPLGSLLRDPSSVTTELARTVAPTPAFATGGRAGLTSTFTEAVDASPAEFCT